MATYYVQTGAASDNSGGTDADDSLSRSGSDGVSTSDTTFESEAANFVAGDAGRGIWINTTVPAWRIIASVTDENTVVLNTALASTENNLDWKIGGSFKTIDLAQNKLAAGDTLYIAPGIYRETIVLDVSGSVGNVISYIGDPQNTQGFKTAAGVTLDASFVMISGYTTNDTTAYAAADNVTASSKDYITFENIWVQGRGDCFDLTTCENWTFRNCVIYNYGTSYGIYVTPAVDTANNLTVDSCIIFSSGSRAIRIDAPTSASADYDLAILIENSLLLSWGVVAAVDVIGTGAQAFFPGGVDVLNCTIASRYGVQTSPAGLISTTIPCTCNNSVIFGNVGLIASTLGQLTEDYCLILATTARTNVSVGGNSQTTARAPYLDLGQSQLWGFLPKMPFSPWPQSRTLGFGGSSPPSTDLLGRPRPSGAGPILASAAAGIGALDCHNYGVKETTTKDAGDASLKLTGPGDHEIRIPVDASATTISIKARFDSATYGGANYPQAILLDATEIGVSTETETATIAASDAWETLTFTQFTPTAKGWVTIRLVNRGSGGDDICYFDTIAVT